VIALLDLLHLLYQNLTCYGVIAKISPNILMIIFDSSKLGKTIMVVK